MTILEAIERAKKLQQGNQRVASEVAEVTGARRAPAPPGPSIGAPVALDFQEYAVNWQDCAQRRVLVDGSHDGLNSGAADAYRVLRTRLWHLMEENQWRSLGITSAGMEEGKSTTSLNLALAMASERRRNIFLLDLDLRRPSLCSYLGLTPGVDVGAYFHGESNLDGLFCSIGVPCLAIAGSRRPYERTSELLGGARLGELLAFVAARDPNALLIVDLPPLLGVADALVVAPKLSATLLVVAEGKTKRDALPQVHELLKNVTVAGLVLNRSLESLESYHY